MCFSTISLSAQQYDFAFSTGGAGNDAGSCVALDSAGNVFCAGFLQQPAIYAGIDLDQSTSFVAKHDAKGVLSWVIGLPTTVPYDLAVDDSGNVYVTGNFVGPVYYGGTDTIPGFGGWDAIVLKYDPLGNFLWARAWGTTTLNSVDAGRAITLHDSLVIVAGQNAGRIFIQAITLGGQMGWSKTDQSLFASEGRGLTVSEDGRFYLSGYYTNNLVMGTTSITGNSGRNALVMELNESGSIVRYAAQIPAGYTQAEALWYYGDHVYITGHNSSGMEEIFVMALDTSLSVSWSQDLGSQQSERSNTLAVNANGVFVGGYWEDGQVTGLPVRNLWLQSLDLSGNLSSELHLRDTINPPNAFITKEVRDLAIAGDQLVFTGEFVGTLVLPPFSITANNADVFLCSLDLSTLVGKREFDLSSEIQIYPNPATDLIFIEPNTNRFQEISLVDFSGRTIMRLNKDETRLMDEKVEISISNLKAGVYQILFDNITIGKIVKV